MLINAFFNAIVIIASRFLAWGKTVGFFLPSPS